MGILDRLLRRWRDTPDRSDERRRRPSMPPARSDDGGILFHDIGRRLMSPTPAVREEAALLVAAMTPAELARPLIRAYVHHGDVQLLVAARAYGHRLTHVVAREALDSRLSPRHRARLMDVLGATADPGARRILREAARDLEPEPRIAASAALADMGDLPAAERLRDELLCTDAGRRTLALDALQRIESPIGTQLAEAHAARYVAEGKAIPDGLEVTLPLLVDRESDLIRAVIRATLDSECELIIWTGDVMGRLADRRRGDFIAGLPDADLRFSTERHSLPERWDVLERACAGASDPNRDRTVIIVGSVPDPKDAYPSPQLLRPGPARYSVLLGYVGPRKLDPVMDWWHYLDRESVVPVEMVVVLTDLALGGGRLTEEELTIHRIVSDADVGERPDAFARAYLARLRDVHT